MALDHFVSQVHLKNFYAKALGQRMYAIRKTDLKAYTCDSRSQCRIQDGSTNPYLQEPRAIEEFLKDIEPRYNASLEKLRTGKLDPETIFTIAGFAAFVAICSPAGMRIQSEPMQRTVELSTEMLDGEGRIPTAPPLLDGVSITELLQSGAVKVEIDPKYTQSMGISSITENLSIWGNSHWDIVVNEVADSPFFTSDFPVAIECSARSGVINRIIPLSPNLAIRIHPDIEQRGLKNFSFQNLRIKHIKASRHEITAINKTIVQCAETTVYYSKDLPWITRFVAKYQDFHVAPDTQRIPYGSGHMLVSSMFVRPKGSAT